MGSSGLEAIADGKVGVIVLAGGQATRLGASLPKGTLSLNLEGFSHPDSLLAIQAARIARLQRLASTAFPDSKPMIQWCVLSCFDLVSASISREKTFSVLLSSSFSAEWIIFR